MSAKITSVALSAMFLCSCKSTPTSSSAAVRDAPAPTGAVTWFDDPYANISKFLNLADDAQTTYTGADAEGHACSFGVTKTASTLVFSPLGVKYAPALGETPARSQENVAFVVPTHSSTQGGYSGDELWANFFIDDGGAQTVPGQNAMVFKLEIKRGADAAPAQIRFAKYHSQDQSAVTLVNLSCKISGSQQ